MAGARRLPVADPWFVDERVGDGITLVTEPHVHPLLRCNVWHVRGRDRDLVVDTSLGLRPLRHLVEPELGHACSPSPPTSTATTSAGCTSSTSGPIHPAEAAELAARRHDHRSTPTVYGEAVLGPYRDAGYDIPELLRRRRARRAGWLRPTFDRPAAPATRLLADGDVVDLGDRAFEVLHLPGHSPGSIGLWEAATGVLFSGDAVYDGPLLDELDGSDIDDYVATMRRLRELPVTRRPRRPRAELRARPARRALRRLPAARA